MRKLNFYTIPALAGLTVIYNMMYGMKPLNFCCTIRGSQ